MTSAVQSGSTGDVRFCSSSLRAAAEPEPVIPTVAHADIWGIRDVLELVEKSAEKEVRTKGV